MKVFVEYSSTRGCRMIETVEGRKAADLRTLGCPEEIIQRIETRNAALKGTPIAAPQPASNAELETLRGQLAAQAQIPATN